MKNTKLELITLLNNLIELIPLNSKELGKFIPALDSKKLEEYEESHPKVEVAVDDLTGECGINTLLLINTILSTVVDDALVYVIDSESIIKKVMWKSEV